jgi:hypothetical protein
MRFKLTVESLDMDWSEFKKLITDNSCPDKISAIRAKKLKSALPNKQSFMP